ncbi:hypothetical protein WG902_06555 [Ramlibacter sp. PS3R-8]|uniref:hypothetical protein n=1 Tax=Ramlibacter sp. PS3R-8 TaxID=3133437 RepID=UPI00309DB913
MNYRCPKCSHRLKVRTLFFHDISTCSHCGTKVVLGDVLAFFMAALTMLVAALTSLYMFTSDGQQYLVAAGYAVSIGMVSGILVLLVLGRATPFRRSRVRDVAPSDTAPVPTSKM